MKDRYFAIVKFFQFCKGIRVNKRLSNKTGGAREGMRCHWLFNLCKGVHDFINSFVVGSRDEKTAMVLWWRMVARSEVLVAWNSLARRVKKLENKKEEFSRDVDRGPKS